MARDQTIGFIGLGAMGLGMASCASKAGFPVTGFDINPAAVRHLENDGGKSVNSPRAAAQNADILVIVVATCAQATSVMFDNDNGALAGLRRNTIIVLCITAEPEYVVDLGARLKEAGRSDLGVIDCPISGGKTRAWQGKLSLFCAGKEADIRLCRSLLDCLGSHLHIVSGNIGAASSVKMAHQILVGVHILASVEAIGLSYAAGLDLGCVYDAVMKSDAASWLFGQRAAHMLDENRVPTSSLSIILKDLVSKLFCKSAVRHRCHLREHRDARLSSARLFTDSHL